MSKGSFLPAHIDHFFFEKISAKGFGLMRILWGLTGFFFMAMQWQDLNRYYTADGIISSDVGWIVFRSSYRFTLLETFSDSLSVHILFVILLITFLMVAAGVFTRISLFICVILLFSFQEQGLMLLAGGDTVMRNLGFIMVLAPEIRAFSLDRYWKQKKRGPLLEPEMSIWPYRLLLWQVIIIYVTSAWAKATGTMWADGTAFAAILHNTHFIRFDRSIVDPLTIISPFVSAFTLIFMWSWLLLLVPKSLTEKLPSWIPHIPLKRVILLMGVLFHGGILITMEVGSFFFTMMASYLGLLDVHDLKILAKRLRISS